MAFAHAALWAFEVDISAHPHPYLTAIVLKNSASHPLDIKLHYVTEEYDTAVLAQWFKDPYRSRIRSIDIETTGSKPSRRLIKVLGTDFPQLRTIKLLNEPDEDPERSFYEEPPPPDVPKVRALSIQRAPVLEKIELRDYVPSWTSIELYTQVTHLEVHISGGHNFAHLPKHAELRAILTSMHGLETLILDDVFPLYQGTTPPSPIPIAPTCRSIKLRASELSRRMQAASLFPRSPFRMQPHYRAGLQSC